MIFSGVEELRDPFFVRKGDTFYLYGTGYDDHSRGNWEDTVWACYVNKIGKLDGKWEKTQEPVYVKPEGAVKNFWAPEVHEYKGAYYMIATYFSSQTQHRGCTILKSDFPEGPFVEITNGHITPKEWDAIDGTLYVDPNGQPWMVFVHEWTCTDDGVGRMALAKLSHDLTHFISEPVELFRATDPSWTDIIVTDGCFLYTTQKGTLLMIWSNGSKEGYCVGIARSKSGKIAGPWEHDDERLFYRKNPEEMDGGHGMIFTHTDGQMYLVIHGPNRPTPTEQCSVYFLPIKEENDTLTII